MELDSGTNKLIPLPEFPQRYASGFPVRSSVGFRRFGIFEDDLRLDFRTTDRALLATRLLDLCTVDPDGALPENFFLDLSVGKRTECLLILALGRSDDALHFPFKCSACNEELEFELSMAELSAMQREADQVEVIEVEVEGNQVKFRKLSGRDQEFLSKVVFEDEVQAATDIVSKLAVERERVEHVAAGDLQRIEEAMDEADPLVNFTCRVACDECGQPNDHDIDLFETALGMLARAQSRLIISAHRLASHYHWSEREIFAVPVWRREQYLELIGAKV
jgi:hypothetical protein